MEDHGNGVGVVPEVLQFVVGVAVVGVHRNESGLVHTEHALEVLGAVVHVLRHFVLVVGARSEQRCSDAIGATIELAPREHAVALHLRRCFGKAIGVVLPHFSKIPT